VSANRSTSWRRKLPVPWEQRGVLARAPLAAFQHVDDGKAVAADRDHRPVGLSRVDQAQALGDGRLHGDAGEVDAVGHRAGGRRARQRGPAHFSEQLPEAATRILAMVAEPRSPEPKRVTLADDLRGLDTFGPQVDTYEAFRHVSSPRKNAFPLQLVDIV